ncbi:DUF4197 domain-containing protein [Marinimicrobium alkaliphilum]|uniref:DUF4197 domain-containing protein n=1 Tax=Marinimicrobium alkaliphilum TaxID=2202654 RepID=UPI000DB9E047|nr:DUF4197 domain-containing protein [Marinimicrobium alkaliphilum]
MLRLNGSLITTLLAGLLLVGCSANLSTLDDLLAEREPTQRERVMGIREALELGATRAAGELSQRGGYAESSLYRIELPEELQSIAQRLRQFGMGNQLDEVERLMNRAAEHAAGEAREVFVDVVRDMTVTDALGIIRGHETAATEYFRDRSEGVLKQRYQPIIESNLRQIGFYSYYQDFLSVYQQLPLSNKPDIDLEQHVLNRSLDGLFRQVAVEEGLIREDPLGRGSRLIERVFRQ